MSILQLSLLIPNSSLLQKYEATFALWMMFLLGRQAMLGQEPPIYFRSMTAVFIPLLARLHEINLPPAPLPSTRTSYSSGWEADVFMMKIFVVSPSCSVPHF